MGMKTCSKCLLEKDEADFTFKRGEKRKSICRDCSKAYCKEHYQKNKKYYVKRARKFNDRRVDTNRQLLSAYLKIQKCADCGNTDFRVLEFDHKQREEKRHNVCNMLWRYTWETILEEIAKCDVRCANCHRIKTVNQLGWYRGK